MLNSGFNFRFITLLFALLFAACHEKVEPQITYHKKALDAINKMTNAGLNHSEARAHYIDSVYADMEQVGAGDLWKRYNLLAMCSKHDLDFYYALTYADSAIWVIRNYTHDPQYKLLYAQANIIKGGILLRINRYSEASRTFYLARSLMTESSNTCEHRHILSLINSNIASVSYKQQHYKDAVQLYKQTVTSLVGCDNSTEGFASMQNNLDNIGLSFMGNNEPDSAIKYYNKALAFIDHNRALHPDKKRFIESAIGVIYGNRAKAFEYKKQYSAAEGDYKQSIKINTQDGYENADANYANIGLAGLYLKIARPDSANLMLRVIEANTRLDTVALLRYLKLKADYFKATGNFKSATGTLEKYLNVKKQDEINSNNLYQADPNKDFELLDQRYKFATLEKDNQLKTTYLINAIVFCIMCSIIIVFFIKTRSRAWAKMDNVDTYNKQLKLAVSALEQRNKDFGQLLNVLGHDLKNPMTAIGNMAEILQLEEDRPEEEIELLDLIRIASRDMIIITNDLLEINTNPDLSEADHEIIEVEELLFNSVALMKHRAMEKDQQIYLGTPGETYVKINREKLWRVINNLIVNAIKFSRSHSSIYVNMQHKDNMVEISVKDNGIGIPEHLKTSLFDLFTDAKRRGTAGEKSYGLGLHTSKRIVESFNGKIWFESAEHEGSTFYLSFPIQKIF
ncbi:tetratricopeptide repeat-containing sensor histidine kinase [Mucilaginibacter agri]|uniref:histidine kinase n=1 Tax=Mucilaginibacter agri TaxID=2695265 RepID=A0A966DTI5_9SPHI|nr:HAMP domain-containing sensor histidine kinase [Mucilaginibacter agri]NCD68724.1 hypothetical protein [Mucilaginibacter agri]